MKKTVSLLFLVAIACCSSVFAQQTTTDQSEVPAALNFNVQTIDGQDKALAEYEGKVLVIVNVASRCGMTPQYAKLQALHDKYSEKGLAVLGFPCNQFGGQEPGTEQEIKSFCVDNYKVAFDMFSKIEVNGDNANGLYKYLTSLELTPKSAGDVSWNFEKFLLDRKGNVIGRYGSRTDPTGEEFVAAIEQALDNE